MQLEGGNRIGSENFVARARNFFFPIRNFKFFICIERQSISLQRRCGPEAFTTSLRSKAAAHAILHFFLVIIGLMLHPILFAKATAAALSGCWSRHLLERIELESMRLVGT